MVKRNSKFLACFMATAMLLGNTVPAFASEISTGGNPMTGSTPAELSVAVSAVVAIPASLELIEDENGNYSTSGIVSAYGILNPEDVLKVSTDSETTCVRENTENVTLTGTVTFGTDGVEQWTADQTRASMNTLDSRAIDVTIAKEIGHF